MNSTIKGILILVIILIANANVIGQARKILFLGNSYTAVNNLPLEVFTLALSLDDSIYYDSYAPGGYRLMNHATDATTLAKISKEDWDFVVIQAQSQEPSWRPSQVATEVLPYATILNDSIKSNNACTETIFYMTWGRKNGDQQNCPTWPPVCTFTGMQERLMTGYVAMAEQNNATLAPVGLAWKEAMDNDPDSLINLFSQDNSHPSVAGTYLTACVMYATLFQKSPLGAKYFAGLSESDALFLQQVAEDVVLNESYNFTFFDSYTNIDYDLTHESWFDKGSIALAGFSWLADGATYQFIDNSLNGETYFWDFGDGETSSLQNPTHTYAENNIYLIKQSVANSCFEDEAEELINVVVSSSEEISNAPAVSIYPNPGNGLFTLTIQSKALQNKVSCKVYDAGGKIVFEDKITGKADLLRYPIDLSALGRGFYQLRITMDELVIIKTLIIQ